MGDIWVHDISGSRISTLFTPLCWVFFSFMNNSYELWFGACKLEVWSCPQRERHLWQDTRLLWFFFSAGRQQVNKSSIKVCTVDPVTYRRRGWKSVLCVSKYVLHCFRLDRCGPVKLIISISRPIATKWNSTAIKLIKLNRNYNNKDKA